LESSSQGAGKIRKCWRSGTCHWSKGECVKQRQKNKTVLYGTSLMF
jgi:hypothetical protein